MSDLSGTTSNIQLPTSNYKKRPPFQEALLIFLTPRLHGETLPASAGTAGIGVAEIKSFAVESVGEVEGGIDEVQETFKIGYQFHAVIFKCLVHGFGFVVKVQFVTEP